MEIEPRPSGPLTDAEREAAAGRLADAAGAGRLTLQEFSDRELRLAPVRRVPGTPLIHVKAYTVMGDVKIRSSGVEEPADRDRHLGR